MRAGQDGGHARIGAVNEIADGLGAEARFERSARLVHVEADQAPGANDAFGSRSFDRCGAGGGKQTEARGELENAATRVALKLLRGMFSR